MPFRTVLVTGGARSGKSAYAEGLVRASGRERVYVATCVAGDGEMRERVARHRDQRGEGWLTLEEPRDIAGVIAAESRPGRALLVDCLTLWLSNILFAEADPAAETLRLRAAIAAAAGPVVLVTNEVGSGIVPDNALARRFRDEQGRLNRLIAEAAEAAVLVAAGLPLVLKPNSAQPEITL
jgi:adenosylcobinamide kinase/adenosylcobinamide-phosphate guanylyltransferase